MTAIAAIWGSVPATLLRSLASMTHWLDDEIEREKADMARCHEECERRYRECKPLLQRAKAFTRRCVDMACEFCEKTGWCIGGAGYEYAELTAGRGIIHPKVTDETFFEVHLDTGRDYGRSQYSPQIRIAVCYSNKRGLFGRRFLLWANIDPDSLYGKPLKVREGLSVEQDLQDTMIRAWRDTGRSMGAGEPRIARASILRRLREG